LLSRNNESEFFDNLNIFCVDFIKNGRSFNYQFLIGRDKQRLPSFISFFGAIVLHT